MFHILDLKMATKKITDSSNKPYTMTSSNKQNVASNQITYKTDGKPTELDTSSSIEIQPKFDPNDIRITDEFKNYFHFRPDYDIKKRAEYEPLEKRMNEIIRNYKNMNAKK